MILKESDSKEEIAKTKCVEKLYGTVCGCDTTGSFFLQC